MNVCGSDLATLTAAEVEDQNLDIFLGSSFPELRTEAAFQLFEVFYPDDYQVWEKSTYDGLIFDTDRFLAPRVGPSIRSIFLRPRRCWLPPDSDQDILGEGGKCLLENGRRPVLVGEGTALSLGRSQALRLPLI